MSKVIATIAAMVTLMSSLYADYYTNRGRFCPTKPPPCPKDCSPPICEQGDVRQCLPPLPCAFNAPAHNRVRSDCKCWQMFGSASFIYWQALEEGLTLAWTAPSGSAVPPSVALGPFPNTSSERVNADFDFRPGFKVGAGSYFSWYDDWEVSLDWTHLGFKNKHRETPDSGFVFVQNEWLLSDNPAGAFDTSLMSVWRFKLDFLDFALSRPFYNSNRLILNPYFGGRAAWISQHFRVDYTLTSGSGVISHNKSNSWALGARGGLNGNWLLGLGFRLQGNAGASLLFADYHVNHTEDNSAGTEVFAANQDIWAGRFMAEMALGFGWGAYFKRCQYHIDFSATYDFNYLPRQNVMRQLVNDYNLHTAIGANDLFLHGLTVTGRLDF